MWSSFANLLPIYSLAALGLTSSVAADYYVDNANNTVAYVAGSGTNWRTFSFATQNLTLVTGNGNVTVDSSKCYDQNYALGACTVGNNCQITFPFTGSGISIYVMHAGFQGVSANLTIDGGQSVTATLPAPAPPSYQTPNVSLFDLQFLPSADHTATIHLLDWNNGATSLYFDYALINESYVAPVSSSTLSMTSTAHTSTGVTLQSSTTRPANAPSTSPTTISTFSGSTYTSGATSAASNADSSVNLGSVVGGVCGGLAALVAIVTAIIFLKKRKSRHAKLEESWRPDPFPPTPPLARDQIASSPAHSQTDEKTRMRLAALYQSCRQSDGEPTDFHIRSAAGNAGRTPEVGAGPLTADPFSRSDFIIDCRPSSDSHGSVVRNTPPPTVRVDSAPPPGYKTLEPRRRKASK